MDSKILKIIGILAIVAMVLSLGCIQQNNALDGNTGGTNTSGGQNTTPVIDNTDNTTDVEDIQNPPQDDEFTSVLDQILVDVDIKDFTFSPSKIIVSKGTTVAWTNNDSVTHKIMVNDFLSGNINQGGVFKYVFDDVGTYEYYCTLHPSMRGTIVVQ